MKILLDKEFKEIKETIEMYHNKYNEALEDYYKLNKENKNLHELLVKFQSKNQKLRNKLEDKYKKLLSDYRYLADRVNKAIEKLKNTLNTEEPVLVEYEIETLVDILEGNENE